MTVAATPSPPFLLETQRLGKAFRGLVALHDHALQVREGEIVGVIGPNGSGKSTLFNLITGFLKPSWGEVKLRGQDITALSPARINRLGIARTFQGSRLFGELSVLDNVRSAAQLRHPVPLLPTLLGLPAAQSAGRETDAQALALLELIGLDGRAAQVAKNLPYGDARRLEIARALATQPKLLMLDEPAAGLNSSETRDLATLIARIRGELGVTVMVIEHDMDLVMNLCERVQVLAQGEVIGLGTPAEVQASPQVRDAYLGAE